MQMNIQQIIEISKVSVKEAAEIVSKQMNFWEYQKFEGLSDKLHETMDSFEEFEELDKAINVLLINKHSEGYKEIANNLKGISDKLNELVSA